MVTELNNPITMYNAPVIDFHVDLASVKTIWGAIVHTPDKIAKLFTSISSSVDCDSLALKRKWIMLSAAEGSVFMGLDNAASLLNMDEEYLSNRLKSISEASRVGELLQLRLLSPSWSEIDRQFPRELQSPKESLLRLANQTYQLCLNNPILAANRGVNKHYRRTESQTPLPLEHSADGKLYTILKSLAYSPPWKKGSFKRIYLAVNLQTLKLAVWAKVSLQSESRNATEQVLSNLENEIAILKKFQTDEFIKILHNFIYQGKKGNDKMSIMFEFCDTDLSAAMTHLTQSRKNPMTEHSLWNIFEDICSSLVQLEKKHIHHHDIKPSNIFLQFTSNLYRAKLGDFGFVMSVADERSNPWYCGSPEYLAPEFVQGHWQMQAAFNQICRLELKIEAAFKRKHDALHQLEVLVKTVDIQQHLSEVIISELTLNALEEAQQLKLIADMDISSAKEELEKAYMLKAEGALKAARTLGDVWGLGHVLFEMRTGEPFLDILTGLSSSTVPGVEFMQYIANLTQSEIDGVFSAKIEPGSLEELNRRMLTVDPDARITAKEALAEIQRMRQLNLTFK